MSALQRKQFVSVVEPPFCCLISTHCWIVSECFRSIVASLLASLADPGRAVNCCGVQKLQERGFSVRFTKTRMTVTQFDSCWSEHSAILRGFCSCFLQPKPVNTVNHEYSYDREFVACALKVTVIHQLECELLHTSTCSKLLSNIESQHFQLLTSMHFGDLLDQTNGDIHTPGVPSNEV